MSPPTHRWALCLPSSSAPLCPQGCLPGLPSMNPQGKNHQLSKYEQSSAPVDICVYIFLPEDIGVVCSSESSPS